MKTKILVCTLRNFNNSDNAGRGVVFKSAMESLSKNADIEVCTLKGRKSGRFDLFLSFIYILYYLLLHPSMIVKTPLQSYVFFSLKDHKTILNLLKYKKNDIIFFEGMRTTFHYHLIPKEYTKDLATWVDIDDILSRRYKFMLSSNKIEFDGALVRGLSSWFKFFLSFPILIYIAVRIEYLLCRRCEVWLGLNFDVLFLSSSYEAGVLKRYLSRFSRCQKTGYIFRLPYFFDINKSIQTSGIDRFVFVGSDSQPQNMHAIRSICTLWNNKEIRINVHIYGKVSKRYAESQHVFFHGWVEDLNEVYSPGSALLLLSKSRGGIKIKVLEGLSHGVPVVGSLIAFEGVGNFPKRLCIENIGMGIIKEPEKYENVFDEILILGRAEIQQEFSAERAQNICATAISLR